MYYILYGVSVLSLLIVYQLYNCVLRVLTLVPGQKLAKCAIIDDGSAWLLV